MVAIASADDDMPPERLSRIEELLDALKRFNEERVEDCQKCLLSRLDRLEKILARMDAGLIERRQEWFTVKQAAILLDKSEYTIRQYIAEKKLAAVKDDDGGAGGKGTWLISREAINRFREPKVGVAPAIVGSR